MSVKKINKNKPKKVEEPVDELTLAIQEEAKVNEFLANTTKEVYQIVFGEGTPLTQERIQLSKALMELRRYDIVSEQGTDAAIARAIRDSREIVLKTIIFNCVKNGVMMSDVMFVVQALSNECCLLPVWEYEHGDEVDDVTIGQPEVEEEAQTSPEAQRKMKDVFESLGKKSCQCDDGECDD